MNKRGIYKREIRVQKWGERDEIRIGMRPTQIQTSKYFTIKGSHTFLKLQLHCGRGSGETNGLDQFNCP